MDPRTIFLVIFFIIYLIIRGRARVKKSADQNTSPQNKTPETQPSQQPKRRTREDIFRDVETKTKPFGDRSIPKTRKPIAAKTAKPVSKPALPSQRVMAESAPVPYGEISDTDINKTEIGSKNEGQTGKRKYAISLRDAVIATVILTRPEY